MIGRILLRNAISDQMIYSSHSAKQLLAFLHTTPTSCCNKQQSDTPSSISQSDPFTAKLQEKTVDDLHRLLDDAKNNTQKQQQNTADDEAEPELPPAQPDEIGGRRGPEPTRFGDWENKGRCYDF